MAVDWSKDTHRGLPVTEHMLLENQQNRSRNLPDTENAINNVQDTSHPCDDLSELFNAIEPGYEGKDTARAAGRVSEPQTSNLLPPLQAGSFSLRRRWAALR